MQHSLSATDIEDPKFIVLLFRCVDQYNKVTRHFHLFIFLQIEREMSLTLCSILIYNQKFKKPPTGIAPILRIFVYSDLQFCKSLFTKLQRILFISFLLRKAFIYHNKKPPAGIVISCCLLCGFCL
jgi:hypothetical protein